MQAQLNSRTPNPFSFAVAALVLLPTPNAIAAHTRTFDSNLRTTRTPTTRATFRRASRNLIATAVSIPTAESPSAAAISQPVVVPPATSPENAAPSLTTTPAPGLLADATANAGKIDSQSTAVTPRTRIEALLPNKLDTTRQKVAKCLVLLALLSSVATVATIAVFWVIQDGLVYKPTSVWRGNPKANGMPDYDDVAYKTSDGETIRGWFIRRPGREYLTARTIIYFHGTDKNASFRLKKVVGLYEKCNANVLLVSYRGYGLSSGHPNEQGLRRDAEGALHYLVGRGDVDVTPGGSRLWVYGESLGGAVALYFTERFQTRVNALVLENTFTSLLDMITLQFPILGPARYLSRNRWLSKRRITRIPVPILFLSGLADAYIPPAMMKKMHRAAVKAKFKRFVPFPGGTHNRTWTRPGFYEEVDSFMADVETDDAGIAPAAIPLKSRVGDTP